MSDTRFNYRSFTTLILAWTFLALTVSGTILYVSPPGRIANWTRWGMLALTKQQWQAVHTLSAIVCLAGGLFHLLKFNWKVFVNYLRKRSETRRRFRWEIVGSLGLFLLVMAGTITSLPPFSTVMVTGEKIKESWGVPGDEPPVPHLELQSLGDVASKLDIKPETAVRVLQEKGITAPGANAPLRDVASQNRRTPREVYDALQQASGKKPEPGAHGAPGSGSGMGARTVSQVAKELRMTDAAAVAALADKGFEARPEEDLRTVSFRRGRRPFEVFEILKAAAAAVVAPANASVEK
jgi:Domain of unknown function (DUF4405)